jgi:hypothetical protein
LIRFIPEFAPGSIGSAYTYSGPLSKAGIWTPLMGISSSNPILSQSRAEQGVRGKKKYDFIETW